MSAEQHHLGREIGARHISDGVEAVWRALIVELRLDVELDLHRHALVEDANHPVVVLDRQRDHRHASSGLLVARAGAAWKDGPTIWVLLLPGQIAAAGSHIAVAATIEHRNDAFLCVEIRDLLAERGRLTAAAAATATAAGGNRC